MNTACMHKAVSTVLAFRLGGKVQEADAEEEDEGGGQRQRARDVRRDARQAERELQANRMRKKDVRPVPPLLKFSSPAIACSAGPHSLTLLSSELPVWCWMLMPRPCPRGSSPQWSMLLRVSR